MGGTACACWGVHFDRLAAPARQRLAEKPSNCAIVFTHGPDFQ